MGAKQRGGNKKCAPPRHCERSLVGAETVKKNLCLAPGVDLIQGEWQKHGRCAGFSANQYYAKIRDLWTNLQKPDLRPLLSADGETTAGAVIRAFVDADRRSGLFGGAVRVRVAGKNRLQEALICYDPDFRYAACGMTGAPDRQKIKVTGRIHGKFCLRPI